MKSDSRVRKTAFHVVYGRTIMILLMLLLQILMLVALFRVTGKYAAYLINFAGSVLVVLVLNRRGQPAYQMTWILILCALPVFGALFYLFVKVQPGTRKMRRTIAVLNQKIRQNQFQDPTVLQHLEEENADAAGLAHYLSEVCGYPAWQNTEIKYLSSGEAYFEELKKALKRAEKFIFLEFFIVADGSMLDELLEILIEKARNGVEVRFLLDGTNTLLRLPYHFPKLIEQWGISCRMFAPVRPTLTSVQNNRDHRKVVVIDGKVGFTGGANIADEYVNRKVRFGHWKDSGIMICGDAVSNLTLMFLETWNIGTQDPESFEPYLLSEHKVSNERGFVIPYADNPFDEEEVGEHVYLDMIFSARKYLHITTPYLIIGYEMVQALIYAAKRGVEVELILPHIPDKWYAFALARTYYTELIAGGVHIYEYTPGFIHAKSFVADDRNAVVGTVNLDFRSLNLHFENAIFFCNDPEVENVEKDFRAVREKSHRMTIEEYRKFPWIYRVFARMLRLIAPLM